MGDPGPLDRTVDVVVLRRAAALADADSRRYVADLPTLGVELVLLDDASADTTLPAVLADADARGVGPGLVLLVLTDPADRPSPGGCCGRCVVVAAGDRHGPLPPGVGRVPGPHAVRRLLAEQVTRRRRRRVPTLDPDPAWTVDDAGSPPQRRRVDDTLCTLATGGVATRGTAEEEGAHGIPPVLAAGVYRGRGPATELRPLPRWTDLHVDPAPRRAVRTLDLRTGVLLREEPDGGPGRFRSLRLASAARPGLVALRAEADAGRLHPGRGPGASGRVHPPRRPSTVPGAERTVAVAATQHSRSHDGLRTVERIAAYRVGVRGRGSSDVPGLLGAAEAAGFDALLAENRRAWAARWSEVDVRVPGDPEVQRGLRLALFSLWALVPARADDELAVGARGATGPGYRGHVFWDADVFVLPALVAVAPAAARAMVRYRLARLPAARRRARAAGHDGARFPWESAGDGEEVTPRRLRLAGRTVDVRTGALEEHVTADVAWAAAHLARWTNDRSFLLGPARPLLLETARYWASRCSTDRAGRAHLTHVIGPDEYHEDVDDDVFTNGMARWNLRAAADLGEYLDPADPEPTRWRALADRLVDGLRPDGRHEQFAGYDALEPLRATDVARPPMAADLLLGRRRVARSQLIKQPDVLMLHHLVPREAGPGSLAADVAYYAPRTAHGSSLSPGVSAAVLARAGRGDEAVGLLRTGLALDLDDLTGTTAAGLHLGGAAGCVQAVLVGFLGARVDRGVLLLDPRPPAVWPHLEVRFRVLGARLRVEVGPREIVVRTDRAVRVRFPGRSTVRVTGTARLDRSAVGTPA